MKIPMIKGNAQCPLHDLKIYAPERRKAEDVFRQTLRCCKLKRNIKK
jgi:hypothetical protein